MITVLFLLAIVVALVSFRKKRGLKPHSASRSLEYKFWEYCAEFFTILSAVLLAYHVLLLLLLAGWQYLSVGTLIAIQGRLLEFQHIVAVWKLDWTKSLLLLGVVYVLGMIYTQSIAEKTLNYYKSVKTLSRIIYITALLLTSFTLVGTQVGPPASTLSVNLNKIRSGYGVLGRELEDVVASESTKQIYDQIARSLGRPYEQLPELSRRIDESSRKLESYYSQVRVSYRLRDAEAERTIARYNSRQTIGNLEEAPSGEEKDTVPTDRHVPIETTYVAVDDARAEVRAFKAKLNSETIKVLERPGGKDIVLHIPTLLSGKAADAFLHALGDTYPVLKPVVELLKNVSNEAMKAGVKREIDNLSESAVSHPGDLERSIAEAAHRVAQLPTKEIPPKIRQEIKQEARQMEEDASRITHVQERLAMEVQSIDNATNERLVTELYSPSEDVRENAAQELSRRGDTLSQTHVDRLISAMRDGTESWETDSRREGHCTWYTHTSVKYYAGEALENVKSPRVGPEIGAEARQAQSEGRTSERVTDPGWI
jgi:hypothetical protein